MTTLELATPTTLESNEAENYLAEHEYMQDTATVKPSKPAMNYAKLAKWNNAQPYHKRISAQDVIDNASIAAVQGGRAAWLVAIHAKIDSEINRRRDLSELLEDKIQS